MRTGHNTRRLCKISGIWTTNFDHPISISAMQPNAPFAHSRHISYKSSQASKICGICWLPKQKWRLISYGNQRWNLILWHGNISTGQLNTIMHPSPPSDEKLSCIKELTPVLLGISAKSMDGTYACTLIIIGAIYCRKGYQGSSGIIHSAILPLLSHTTNSHPRLQNPACNKHALMWPKRCTDDHLWCTVKRYNINQGALPVMGRPLPIEHSDAATQTKS